VLRRQSRQRVGRPGTPDVVDAVRAGVERLGRNLGLGRVDADRNAGQGTAGKFLKDPTLYNTANETIANVKKLTDDVNAGKGTIGLLARNQEFADKLHNTMNKISDLSDRLNSGQGTIGKLLQDPAVYDNTNQVLLETRELIKAIRQNPKTYLTIRLHIF